MNPLQVSAQYAAFVWFTNRNKGTATPEEARRFAQDNWTRFLPAAHEGLGRLLIRISRKRESRRAPARSKRRPAIPDFCGVA